MSNRARLTAALAGEPVDRPVFAAYDWFVEHRPIDWPWLFSLGLGQVNHATVTVHDRPHVQVVESRSQDGFGRVRRDIRWITDAGELHEWYLGEWRMEHLIKSPADYRVMMRAMSDVTVRPAIEPFDRSEAALGGNGLTLAVPAINRTPFQMVQIDFAGLERFSMDLAGDERELLELVELMNEVAIRDFEAVSALPVRHIKLWENLSIETMGPRVYREQLVPMYKRILAIADAGGQRLHVHYDGKLAAVAEQIAGLGFAGIDSLTPAPEGDLTAAEARRHWPDKFLWLHPSLGWYSLAVEGLVERVRAMVRDAGPSRCCLLISEEVPPDWRRTLPEVLRALA